MNTPLPAPMAPAPWRRMANEANAHMPDFAAASRQLYRNFMMAIG